MARLGKDLVESLLCESCARRSATTRLPNDVPDQPYFLCSDCAQRIELRSLRPEEWLRLAAIHGQYKFLLHDDFYDDEGRALQPRAPVPPTPEGPGQVDAVGLPKLLDGLFRRRLIERSDCQELLDYDPAEVLEAIVRRVSLSHNVAIEMHAYEICAYAMGGTTADWIRSRWECFDAEAFEALARATAACLPLDEGFELVSARMEHMDARSARANCYALAFFRSHKTLEWIESHVSLVHGDEWGRLAAMSGWNWETAARWLELGRPLSFIAVAAIIACFEYDTVLLRWYRPELVGAPSPEEVITTLERIVPMMRGHIDKIRQLMAAGAGELSANPG